MDISKIFIAEQGGLESFNGAALINWVFTFLYNDDVETPFGFGGYNSAYMYIYNDEKRDQLIKSFTTQVTRNSNALIVNASVADMTFDDPGTYFYVLGYNNSGYEVPLRYGKFKIV